jgi:hypothetical protein
MLLAALVLAMFALAVACTDVPQIAPVATQTPTATATATPEPTVTPTPEPPTATPTVEPTATAEPTPEAPVSSSTTEPAPPGAPTPTELFEAAAMAMVSADSFHFEMLAEIEAESGTMSGGIPLSLVGDFQSPDRLQGELRVSLGFFEFKMQTVSLDGMTYITDPQTGEWQVSENAGAGIPNPAEFTGIDPDDLTGLELLGIETMDGVEVYRLRGVPPAEVVGAAEGDQLAADFWIGVEDKLFRRIEAGGEVSLQDSPEGLAGPLAGGLGADQAMLTVTMTFSDYGKPVEIVAPDLGQ